MYLKKSGRIVQPLVVLAGAEQVKLAVFLVVVAPDTFEAAGAVAESVGQDADFGLAERHHFAFEEAKKRLFLAHVVLLLVRGPAPDHIVPGRKWRKHHLAQIIAPCVPLHKDYF